MFEILHRDGAMQSDVRIATSLIGRICKAYSPNDVEQEFCEVRNTKQHQATPYIRRMSVAPSLATIYACSLLCNECGGADESRPCLLSAYP